MSEEGLNGRLIALPALAGAAGAALSVLLAAAAGSPYLSADRVNGWVVVFAIALLVLVVSIPFALELRLRGRREDRDERWERSILAWGAIAVVVLVLAFLLGNGSGFSGSSLAGTIGLISAIESGLVVAAVGVWLLSN